MIQVLRRYGVWVMLGMALIPATYGVLAVGLPYQRQQWAARKIKAAGGTLEWKYCGPNWLPARYRGTTQVFDRIQWVFLKECQGTQELASDLGSLAQARWIDLDATDITDADLQFLHGLTNLKRIYLDETQTTAQGRATLRRALPDCQIYPDP